MRGYQLECVWWKVSSQHSIRLTKEKAMVNESLLINQNLKISKFSLIHVTKDTIDIFLLWLL